MKIEHMAIAGCALAEFERIEDERGYFARSFCRREFEKAGLSFDVVQTNISFSEHPGTLRGLHYQIAPKEETKLIRCTQGHSWNVVLDIRETSATRGRWCGVELTPCNNLALLCPPGCAHGMVTLEERTEVHYMMGEYYAPNFERGIRWDDPAFRINWPIEPTFMSDRDMTHPNFVI